MDRLQRGASAPAYERFGPFLVVDRLGEGGMATVDRAELVGDHGARRTVALKRLHPHLAEDPDFVAAFVHEGAIASRLRHRHIARAYAMGQIDRTHYIAMEYVPGPTLSQVMIQARRAAGAIPVPIVLEVLRQICDALDYAHGFVDEHGRSLGFVHRDVSPANVIVSAAGVVKLIDFGIAKVKSSSVRTETGVVKGKLAYIAPEYTYGQLDKRADMFGLGVIAHELLVGRRLFLGDSDAETLRNVRELAISPPSRNAPQVSRELDAIVMTALERDPSRRWQNAAAMRVALAEEAARLGVRSDHAMIRSWMTWAFRLSTRRDTVIGRLLSDLEPSISVEAATRQPSEPSISVEVAAGYAKVSDELATCATVEIDPCIRASGEIEDLPTLTPPPPVLPSLALAQRPTTLALRRAPARRVEPARRRAPRWEPPTRWARLRPPASHAPLLFLLLVVVGMGAALHAGYIDVATLIR
jgi:serine/threonine protein kinase